MSAPRYAIIAHRETGSLRSVTAEKARDLAALGSWFIVCTETDDLYWDQQTNTPAPVKLELRHHHSYGNPEPGCPALRESDLETFALVKPEDWTADDMNHLHEQACRLLRFDGAIWTLNVSTKYGQVCTEIEICDYHTNPTRGPNRRVHALVLRYIGHPNPATIAWLARAAGRYALSAGINAADVPVYAKVPRTKRRTEGGT